MAEAQESRPPVPVRIYQPTFGAGELAPALHRRSDLAKWRAGAALLSNFIVTAQGGAARRAGTAYVGQPGQTAWLIPFQFSTEDQYILELVAYRMRFISGGAYVMNGGSPYEIATPYAAAELALLAHVQSADVLTIVHSNHAPAELRRYAATDWRLVPLTIGSTMAAPTGIAVSPVNHGVVPGTPAPADLNFIYAVTATSTVSADEGPLSAPVTCVNNNLGYYNQYGVYNIVTWAAVAGASFYTVYRKYQGVWSKIGSTTDLQFDDIDYVPDTSTGPPAAINPFTGSNWPGAVGYFQERRVFGGSLAYPETMWFSKSGAYNNFDVASPVKDDDAITYTLAARQVNQIRHLLPLNDLIVMTGGGGWKISNSSGGAVTPGTFDAAPQSFVGASPVTPLVIGNRVLFIEAKGASVREIAYQFVQNSYVSEDRSVFAKHLLLGHAVASWAYAESPDKIIWIVRDDGALLSLTYLPEQDVFAWAQHSSPGAQYVSVAVITEQLPTGWKEDVAYFSLLRNGVPMIERMQSRQLGTSNLDPRAAWHVDCGVYYNGTPITSLSGLAHLEGQTVAGLADGVVFTGVVSGGVVALPAAAQLVVAGVLVVSTLISLPADGPQPAQDPWMGRPKHGYMARVAVENALGVRVSIDGGGLVDLVLPSGDAPPMTTGVFEARPAEGWTTDGKVTVSCGTPQPCTVLGIAMEWGVGK